MNTGQGRLSLFDRLEKGLFLRRPNRFVIECSMNRKIVKAHMPNPGRLWELLQPGRTVYLAESHGAPGKKTDYTAVAVERGSSPVFLHTHHTNTIAGWLIQEKAIAGLEEYSVVKPEYTVGRSRFDFLLQGKGAPLILEVKSCTLFHDRLAMFPDAVTKRGKRHVEELARSETPGGVLFIVHSNDVRSFLPEYHVDMEFAKTLHEHHRRILVKAVAVDWDNKLSLGKETRELSIPWEIVGREGNDRGAYLLIFRVNEDKEIQPGRLGKRLLKKGFYIYVGSAMKNLTARIERHKRRRKNLFWHVDCLREEAELIQTLPIRSSKRLECEIATTLSRISNGVVDGFGSSDCGCDSHLFYMETDPVHRESFIDLLLHFRMTIPSSLARG